MRRISKVIIMLFLATVMVFCVVGCNVGTQNDLQAKIDDLQSQIEELQDRLAEQEEQIRERDEQIEQLEMELAKNCKGTFYTLQEAYDNGYLTKEDLEVVVYHYNNDILYPQALDKIIAEKIKQSAAFNLRNQENSPIFEAKAEDFVLLNFYGSYDGSYVVMLNDPYSVPPAEIIDFWDEIAGVKIHYIGHHKIVVWREEI